MKNKLILPVVLTAICAGTSAFAGEALIMNEEFDNLSAWVQKAYTGSIESVDAKLSFDTKTSSDELKVYKYNGTNSPTYFQTPIGENYKFETQIQISDFFEGGIENGHTAKIDIYNQVTKARYELAVYIEKDGLYALGNNGVQNICKKEIDNEAHIYSFEVGEGFAEIYMDGDFIYSYDLPKLKDGRDDLQITAKGSAEDSVKFDVSYAKLSKVVGDKLIFDDVTDTDNLHYFDNIEYKEYEGLFFGNNAQLDLIDPEKDGFIVYKIPDGATMTGFTFNMRKHPNAQAEVYINTSKDGINWTKDYISTEYTYAWFYANGGHRYTITPGKIDLSNAQYVRIHIKKGTVSTGGVATETSPSLICAEVYYTTPAFKNIEINGAVVEDGAKISANVSEITAEFTADIDAENAQKAVFVKSGNNELDKRVSVEGKTLKIALKDALDYGEDITFSIFDDLLSKSGSKYEKLPVNYTFSTYPYDFNLDNVDVFEDAGNVRVSADVENTSGDKKTVEFIVIGYKDGTMTGFDTTRVVISDKQKTTVNLNFDLKDAKSIEVMLWDSLEDMTVLTKKFVKNIQ